MLFHVDIWKRSTGAERVHDGVEEVEAHSAFHAVVRVAARLGLRDHEWNGTDPLYVLRPRENFQLPTERGVAKR